MNTQKSVEQLLGELEKDSISSREKSDILIQVINIESAKSEEDADMDLIQECIGFFNLLTNSEEEIEAQKEQITPRLQQIYQKADAKGTSDDSVLSNIRPATRKPRFRTVGIAAAIFLTILLVATTSLTVIARVNGYGTLWDWISVHLSEIFQSNAGEDGSIDGITVIREKDTKIYPDIESWLQEENLDILFPSDLPDGIRLDHINQFARSEGEVTITLVFNTQDMSFQAQNYDLTHYEILEGMELIEVNGYRFGILYTPEIGFAYHTYGIVGDFAYGIGCNDRDTLLNLINHLR